MTSRADYTEREWNLVLEGLASASMVVVTAQPGGTIQETLAIARAYVEARQHHGASELLDEIVAAKPEIDRARCYADCASGSRSRAGHVQPLESRPMGEARTRPRVSSKLQALTPRACGRQSRSAKAWCPVDDGSRAMAVLREPSVASHEGPRHDQPVS